MEETSNLPYSATRNKNDKGHGVASSIDGMVDGMNRSVTRYVDKVISDH